MDNEEQIQYLANIYHLVRADGQIDRLEEKLIDEIAKGVKAGYFEAIKARDMSEKEDFLIKYPDRWSDRIRCIEDMLLVAYSDKKLHALEKKVLLEYARQLGISQKQFDIIKKETKARLKKTTS